MFPAPKNDRKRYPMQYEKMNYMSKAIRNWRNMSAATKEAWSTFATTFPQPTQKNPEKYLTGYQLFLKRYFYHFMHEGINEEFNLLPKLSILPAPNFEISIAEEGQCIDVTEQYIRNFVYCQTRPVCYRSYNSNRSRLRANFFAPFLQTAIK